MAKNVSDAAQFAVHHIHVRVGSEVYTIAHKGSSIRFSDLENALFQISTESANRFFCSKDIKD